MLRLGGSLVNWDMYLESQNNQTNRQTLSSDKELPPQEKEGELNSLMSQIFECQKNIISNQLIMHKKLVELEQRSDRIEQMVSRKYEHLPKLTAEFTQLADSAEFTKLADYTADSTQVWFENSFAVKEFKIDISDNEQVGTKFPCRLPIVSKGYKKGLIQISIIWIRNDKSLEDEKKQIVEKLTNQMNLYLKAYKTEKLNFFLKIPPSSISVVFSERLPQVEVFIKHTGFPTSSTNKSFLCIGITEENHHSKPAILLNDIVYISKIRLIDKVDLIFISSKVDLILSKLIETKKMYIKASWYKEMIDLFKQRGLSEEGVKASQGKRTRSDEEVENTSKKARIENPIRPVEESNEVAESAMQDYSQLRSGIIDQDQVDVFFDEISPNSSNTGPLFFPENYLQLPSENLEVPEDYSQLRSEIIEDQNILFDETYFNSARTGDFFPPEEDLTEKS
jgi:hypothetical protein